MRHLSVLALALILLFLPSGAEGQEDPCDAEHLAAVYPEFREQLVRLQEGRPTSASWSRADEMALSDLRACPDEVGRRAIFYYAVGAIVRGQTDEAR